MKKGSYFWQFITPLLLTLCSVLRIGRLFLIQSCLRIKMTRFESSAYYIVIVRMYSKQLLQVYSFYNKILLLLLVNNTSKKNANIFKYSLIPIDPKLCDSTNLHFASIRAVFYCQLCKTYLLFLKNSVRTSPFYPVLKKNNIQSTYLSF